MDGLVFVSGAGTLQENGVKWIAHVRSPKSGVDCDQVTTMRFERLEPKSQIINVFELYR